MKSTYFGFLAENRRFLTFGFLMALCSSYGQTFFISVFGGEIRAEFGLTHGTFGLIYSVATLVSGFCMIWAGGQLDRIHLRTFSFVICIGLAGASILTGSTTSPLMLGVAIFALRLFGQGLMSHTSLTAMARYFDQDRGKAISIANLGFPTGQAIFPVICVMLATVWQTETSPMQCGAHLLSGFTPTDFHGFSLCLKIGVILFVFAQHR